MRWFDTAPSYGLSEARLGRFVSNLAASGEADKVFVATKVGGCDLVPVLVVLAFGDLLSLGVLVLQSRIVGLTSLAWILSCSLSSSS